MSALTFGPMKPLAAGNVRWLVYHTAGTPDGIDTSAAAVHAYHRSKGWAGIGYHFLIRKDGTVEMGRPLVNQGAHVEGINHRSLGIAFSGNGDLHPLTPQQMDAGVALGHRLVSVYRIALEDVIGHREVNALVDDGLVPTRYRTSKSCPGVRVPMHRIRVRLANLLRPPPPDLNVPILTAPD